MQKVLLVDDSKSARIIISRLLQKHELEVVTAESGEEALEILKTDIPDVIFMDYMMPGLNGIETMHKVHADPRTANIPVVICTGNEGDSYIDEALSEGASSMLSKPPSPEGIQKAIDDITRVMAERGQQAAAGVSSADVQRAIDRAVANLRAEFEQKLAAASQGGGEGGADLEVRFKALRQEIEVAKRAVFEAVVQRMQAQQTKLLESIKALLAKQRADTIALIKKAMGSRSS